MDVSSNESMLRELMKVALEENEKLNLTALRTQDRFWIGNILDSLALLEILPTFPPISHVTDVGTGGGFPLLPLAICLPEVQFLGIDATQKKIAAIERIIGRLQLTNVQLKAGRSEELGHDEEVREMSDLVTARALAPLSVLLEHTSPFVKPRGHIVCWKSMTIDEELSQAKKAAEELSCHFERAHRYSLSGDFGERQLLIFKKTSTLSRIYPRATGTPAKNPLGR